MEGFAERDRLIQSHYQDYVHGVYHMEDGINPTDLDWSLYRAVKDGAGPKKLREIIRAGANPKVLLMRYGDSVFQRLFNDGDGTYINGGDLLLQALLSDNTEDVMLGQVKFLVEECGLACDRVPTWATVSLIGDDNSVNQIMLFTPFLHALADGRVSVARFLLDKGANPAVTGDMVAHPYAVVQSPDIPRSAKKATWTFLQEEAGVSPNFRPGNYYPIHANTAITPSVRLYTQGIQYLMAGHKKDVKEEMKGAVWNIRELLERGFNPNAVVDGRRVFADLLIQMSQVIINKAHAQASLGEFDSPDEDFKEMARWVSADTKEALVLPKLFLEYGGCPRADGYGVPPLAYACQYGAYALGRMLVKHGADPMETFTYAGVTGCVPVMLLEPHTELGGDIAEDRKRFNEWMQGMMPEGWLERKAKHEAQKERVGISEEM